MPLQTGARLGPYEIVSRIGAGGMGEIFRAKDTRLDRSVAIKVLPSHLSSDPQLRERFDREARAVSALNHPNICTLYDVGHQDGVDYIVMELLEGESLADRLAKGALPLEQVLRYGVQIAEGLDKAHKQGIVHRDLKPGNIMLTRSGAKLLDFGLARILAPVSAVSGLSNMATEHKQLTAEGSIIGTFHYMAPEQLEGLEADARTDIFALGVVLYEMATGRRAFEGKTRTSLIAAIVSGQPPAITNLQPLAPTGLDHVITTCMAKEPDERWQSAHDVAQELRWIESSPTQVPAATRLSARRWIALAALSLLAASAMAALYIRERMTAPAAVSFSMIPPRGYWFATPAISPDGDSVAFVAGKEAEQGVWVRHVGSVAARKIADAAEPGNLFWSPDSKWVGFFDGGRIMKVPSAGGHPETICTNCVSYGDGASWSRSGTILFTPKFAEGLFRVPASGGDAVRLTTLDPGRRETLHGWAKFVDESDRFVYLIHTIADERNQIYGGSLSGEKKTFLVKADSLVGVWKKYLFFVRDGAMYAQRFDASRMRVSGEPRKILDEVSYSEDSAHSFASVARNGAIVYLPAANYEVKVEVGWYDRSGRLVEKLFDDISIDSLALSNDDSKVAMQRFESKKGAYDIYVYDLKRGVRTRLTAGLSNHSGPLWSPSGDRVFFNSDRDGLYDVYARADDGATPAQTIWKGVDDKFAMSISPDGRMLLAGLYSAKTKNDIWLVPLDGDGKPQLLVGTEESDFAAKFSPDGNWIVYTSGPAGQTEVYVRPFPTGRSVQVSTAGGSNPQWSADGSEIYFRTDSREMYAAPFHANGTLPQLGKPALLFRRPKNLWLWMASHTPGRFLGMTPTAPDEEIQVINYTSGWAEKLDD